MVNLAKICAEIEWRHIPLCTTYLLVLFETQRIGVPLDGAPCRHAVRWAFGMHADGQGEVLGVWPGMAAGSDPWREAIDDLSEGGVHRIDFVGGDESIDISAAYPSATVLPLIGQSLGRDLAHLKLQGRSLAVDEFDRLLSAGTLEAASTLLASFAVVPKGSTRSLVRESWNAKLQRLAPFFALSPRRQHLIRFADAEVRRMETALTRIDVRNESFVDQAALAGVVRGALLRAGRKREGNVSGSARRLRNPVRTSDFVPALRGL
ncbi:MAG: transposase [Paucibacter sp.]|nr:transposase [Roseateles sp.]